MPISLRLIACLVLVPAMSVVHVASASAATRGSGDETPGAFSVAGVPPTLLPDCRADFDPHPDGSFRQKVDTVDFDAGLIALPPRVSMPLDRGENAAVCVAFQNTGTEPVDLYLETASVAANKRGDPASQREAVQFGAGDWITPATAMVESLTRGEIAWVPVTVRVPSDALPGSAYGSVVAKAAVPQSGGTGSSVSNAPRVVVQMFFDLEGKVERSGEVERVRAPRLVWWDGLDLGEFPLLDGFRGLGVATVRFAWRNTGTYSEPISGSLVIRSSLTNKVVARIPVDDALVLRDSARQFQVTWSNDIPLLGRFQPTLELERDNGSITKVKLDPIWVIPSWWYLLAVVLALGIPITMRVRSRRRYRDLLERVEAAEARGAADDGMDDEDDEDSWLDR